MKNQMKVVIILALSLLISSAAIMGLAISFNFRSNVDWVENSQRIQVDILEELIDNVVITDTEKLDQYLSNQNDFDLTIFIVDTSNEESILKSNELNVISEETRNELVELLTKGFSGYFLDQTNNLVVEYRQLDDVKTLISVSQLAKAEMETAMFNYTLVLSSVAVLILILAIGTFVSLKVIKD